MLTHNKTPYEEDEQSGSPVPFWARWLARAEKIKEQIEQFRQKENLQEEILLYAKKVVANSLTNIQGLLHDPLYVRLPFEEKRLGLTLAALLSITLYVAFLSIAVNSVFAHAVAGLDRDTARRVTFEVLPDTAHISDPKEKEARAALLAEKLKTIPGVVKVAHLSEGAMQELLAPWLGGESLPPDLPLPVLLDVEMDKVTPALKTSLINAGKSVSGVMMDDHAAWQTALTRAAHGLEYTSGYILILGFAALALMAYFATETHFHINRETIEILHLIGARDNAIARHMGLAVFRFGLLAAGIAFVAVAVTITGLWISLQGLDLSFFPNFSLGFGGGVMIVAKWLAAGFISALLCFATAYVTVLRELRGMV